MKTAITVALIIAYKGFQPVEYQNTKKALEDAGITVHTISTQLGEAEGTDGSKVAIDGRIGHIIPEEYQGIALIGGSGALDYLDNEAVYDVIQKAIATHMVLGAICIAPRILAKAGVLKGKKATGWDEDNELTALFKKHTVLYTKEGVVTDGTIVTATGPATATEFGKALAKNLKK